MAASTSSVTEDVVIAYCPCDIDFVRKLCDTLREAKLSVWYLSPSQLNSPQAAQQKSQAILGCKAFLPILSEDSAGDKQLNDELALAYISNSAIFPVGLSKHPVLAPKLSGGARLMLAKINWIFVFKETLYKENVPKLIECIHGVLQRQTGGEGPDGQIMAHGMNLNMNLTHGLVFAVDDLGDGLVPENTDGSRSNSPKPGLSYDFWDRHFEGKNDCSWKDFREAFLHDYGEKISQQHSEDKKKLFVNLMYKDIFDMKKTITRTLYNQMCGNNINADPHCFYRRIEEYVTAYLSLREVIDMDSTLRITTIQSLGKFSFPAIVSGLSDMLQDEDPNIRAVAAIALAKAGKGRKDTVDKLISILEDEDRLVRESACLSLGYLKSTRAVSYIVDRWRNDPISTVRQAAELALSKMKVEEAQKCMHVTKVLSDEMSALKPQENSA